MYTDEELMDIYINAPVEKSPLEVISLYASWFSKKYYLQNVITDDIEVVLETGETVVAEYSPMKISSTGNNSDMEYNKTVTFAAVNDIIAEELSRRDYNTTERPVLESRMYIMYRDGSVSSLRSPVHTTKVNGVSRNTDGSVFNTSRKPVTLQQTGELVTTERVPMIKGFL